MFWVRTEFASIGGKSVELRIAFLNFGCYNKSGRKEEYDPAGR